MKVSGFKSLLTVGDPARLGTDKEGKTFLAKAVNVDVDRYSRLSRRRGVTQKRADAAHSIWSDGDCFYVSNGSLYQLLSDWTRKGLRSGLHDTPMSFCRAGNEFFYCNGFENGVIKDSVSQEWTGLSYVGPTTDRHFSDPPVGHLVAFYGSSVWIAKDNEVFRSEPFAYAWFDLFKGRLKEASRIRLLAPVSDGIYIGDESSVYFYAGGIERRKVADYPAVEGAVTYADASEVSDSGGRSAIVTTTEGICLAGPSGSFINLTKDLITYPEMLSGFSVLHDNRLITGG